MKKTFSILLILILSVLLCFTLSACDGNNDNPDGNEGKGDCETLGHSYTVLKKSESEHWYECSVCNSEKPDSRAMHFGGNATCQSTAFCSVCSAAYGNIGEHEYDSTAWQYQGPDGHAHKCKYCTEIDTPISHTPNTLAPTEDTAKYCTVCEYIIEQKLSHTHTKASEWEYNSTYHWHDCVKNDGQEYEKAQHTFDDVCDTTCNDGCGYVRTVSHKFTILKKNDFQHWYECSVCNTEKPGGRYNHSGGSATCQVKAVCSVCSESYGSFGNHNYEESVMKKPSTFDTGTKKFLCACGDSYTEDIPATKSLKLLTIGNSFSQNATYHLYKICKDAGIETIVIGNLHKGGCNLQTHLSYMTSGTAGYDFELWESHVNDGAQHNVNKTNALYALEYTDWDYITIQQGSAQSGDASSYSYLDGVLDYIITHKNADAKILWHMTWAYQADSTHAAFPSYNNNQITMYNAILSCVQNKILTNSKISGVIPSGTSIQNLRTSHLGDTLTQDGHHLDKGIGCYTAGLTYLAAITGYDVSGIDYVPSSYQEVGEHLNCIKDAVKKSVATPYSVTVSAYPSSEAPTPTPEPETPDNTFNSTLSPLTEEDKSYLASKGYDPSLYMLLDLKITENAFWHSSGSVYSEVNVPAATSSQYYTYAATQLFSRSELINGSIIRVNSGYGYRPDGWENYPFKSNLTRPDATSAELVVVDEKWWGEYHHRAFNIYNKTDKIYEADTVNFRIYVPVAKRSELTEEDKSYLSGLGLNADDYMVLDLDYTMHGFYISTSHSNIILSSTDPSFPKKFLCTSTFLSRYDITLGSVIRLTSTDYFYRPEGWITLDKAIAKDTRPDTVTTKTVTVDENWWGEWNYRAFNLQKKDGSQMTEEGKSILKIYVKIT